MATYTSSYTQATAYKNTPTHGLSETLKCMSATVNCSAALTTADVIKFFTMPKNAKIQGFKMGVDQLDSNGSPTLTFDVGDAGSATRLFSASVAGRTSGGAWVTDTGSGAQYAALGYQFTADTLIQAVPHANAATGAAGNITLVVYYTLEGGAS